MNKAIRDLIKFAEELEQKIEEAPLTMRSPESGIKTDSNSIERIRIAKDFAAGIHAKSAQVLKKLDDESVNFSDDHLMNLEMSWKLLAKFEALIQGWYKKV